MKTINWQVILKLSLLGLGMAFATISLIPSAIEPLFWLLIFIVCAFFIAKKCELNFFLHGFLLSMVNSVWITTEHVLFYSTYIAHHPEMSNMPVHGHPRLMMLLMGPVFGAFFGLAMGLFAYIASRAFRTKS